MTKHYEVEIRDSIANGVEGFAVRQGIEPDHAIVQLIALGNYVVNSLAEGKEFLVKEGKKMNFVEWGIPEPKTPPSPPKPPTLRIVK